MDFKEVMSGKTSEELVKIITLQRADYQEEAVVAAEEEIKKRGIETDKIGKIKDDLTLIMENQSLIETRKVNSLLRFVNFIVDTIAYFTWAFILAYILGLFFNPTDRQTISIIGYILIAISFFSYYIFLETKFQKTLGKMMTRTSVVTNNGSKPALRDIVTRTFCRLIPLDQFSYLFTRNGFHDKFSGTIVISDEK